MPSLIKRAIHLITLALFLSTSFLGVPRPASAAVMASVTIVTVKDDLPDTTSNTICTLRKAIHAANIGQSYRGCYPNKTIELVGGEPYLLKIRRTATSDGTITGNPIDDDDTLKGDLDIKKGLTIVGNGATIQAYDDGDPAANNEFNDRIFHIKSTTQVTLKDLTITGARMADYFDPFYGGNAGAGILNTNRSNLVLLNVSIFNNGYQTLAGTASKLGGGLANISGAFVYISYSNFEGNDAGEGGAIYNTGTLSMHNSLVVQNNAILGGGIKTSYQTGSTAVSRIYNSTLSTNISTYSEGANGAAIHVGSEATVDLTHVTIANHGKTDNQVAVWLEDDLSTLIMRNTLVVENKVSCGSKSELEGKAPTKIISYGYNRIDQEGRCHFNDLGNGTDIARAGITGIIDIGQLDYNGGSTKNYALIIEGPDFAVQQIPPDKCARGDQRGFSRSIEGKSGCDVGAYETEATEPIEDLKVYLPFITR